MIEDEEFEVLVTTPERTSALGFKPQKENLTNHLLPYADELDAESTEFLQQVKTNLAKAVALREMKPACCVWSSRLMKYIKIYGFKFGKEDHIALAKLAYELVLIPDLEPSKIQKFCTLFVMLTKKRHLISPEELTLPWRPLYELGKKLLTSNTVTIGIYHYHTPKRSGNQGGDMLGSIRKFLSGFGVDDAFDLFGPAGRDKIELPTSLEVSFTSMVKCARPYFEVSATKEILEEFLPQICPWTSESEVLPQLVVFLPVELHPKYAAQGHELWFDKLMELWDTCHNSQCGVFELLSLFAGLAKRNPGAVNWDKCLSKMFTRFLHSLNLPVSYKDMQISRYPSASIKHMAIFIVWGIHPKSDILKQLGSFLSAIESYLHSANAGRWSFKLRDLLRKLARDFLNRVRNERGTHMKKSWENQVPEHYKLTDEQIDQFVTCMLEPTLQAINSRTGTVDISIALQNLATLRPNIVIPQIVEKLDAALNSLTEPHRVTVAMTALAAVARPMLRSSYGEYPQGPTHVMPLLMAVLPGLDPNDFKKTLVTLHFILIFSWMVPYIDCSSAHEYYNDLTPEELFTCESTAQCEDFILIFLDRLFVIIESSVMEHARLDAKENDAVRSKTDALLEAATSAATTAVLMQCSPKIFKEALRKFRDFATQSTFETNVAGSMVGMLLRVFARADAKSTLAAFVPKLCEELGELLSTDEALHEENPPRDLTYRLVLLMHLVQCDGSELLSYVPDLMPILDRALKLHSNYALSRACDILGHIFSSLSYVNLKEWRSSPNDYGEAPQKWLPIREWGKGCSLKTANLKWHIPSAEEAQCAQMLIDRYLKPELLRLRQWLNNERPMCRERLLRSFHILNAVLACSTFLPLPDEEPVMLMPSLVPATTIPLTNGVKYQVTLDGANLRSVLTDLMIEVQARLLAHKSDDTRGFEMLLQVWERIVVMKNYHTGPGLESHLRSFNALERALDGRGWMGGDVPGSARLRMLLADGARLQDEARLDLVCDAGITPMALKALHALYDLSINTYSSVRILSQARLYWLLCRYPYSYRALFTKVAELLLEGGEGDEWHAKHKGALYIMLGPRSGPLIAKQDWEVAKTLWPALLRAPLSEKPSILRLEQAFTDFLHRHFPTVNTRLSMSQTAVDAALHLLPQETVNDPHFANLLESSIEREAAASDATEAVYKELIEEIITIAEAPNIQWRRLEIALQTLVNCPSFQTAYPPRAVKFIIDCLIHEDIVVRRTALRLTHLVLKQRKRSIKKIPFDPYQVAGVSKPQVHIPGYRKDLEWALWAPNSTPKTDEEWDKPWLRNHNCGFYAWPNKLMVAAPASQQVQLYNIQPDEMEEGERYIFEFFSDDVNVDKLVAFHTVEEKKGRDKFNGTRYSVLRFLFAQYGPSIANKFLAHALRCASDTQEAPQRFAAEVVGAALRAPRFWPREPALAFYRATMEVINKGLTSILPETLDDWGTAIASGVDKLDPNRAGDILDGLLRLCAPSTDSDEHSAKDASYIVCARVYALQGAIASLSWRAAPFAKEVLRRLEAANFINHPYQNVRDTVGSVLTTIFDIELHFPGSERLYTPSLEDFLASIRPKLAALYDANGDIVIKSAPSLSLCGGTRAGSPPAGTAPRLPRYAAPSAVGGVAQAATAAHQSEEGEASTTLQSDADVCHERADRALVSRLECALRLDGDTPAPACDHAAAVSLLATVLRGCMGLVIRAVNYDIPCLLPLVGTACAVTARGPLKPGDELPRAAAAFLAGLASAHFGGDAFDAALNELMSHTDDRSWWARLAFLEFAQPLLFYGIPMMCEDPSRAVRAEEFTQKLMLDPRLEVRQGAAKLLTGLLHCQAVVDDNKTVMTAMTNCRSKSLLKRHSGVLGLCAYITSKPYSISGRLGAVLRELVRHTNAPDPIPATIRKAIAEFRRTHQDDWERHISSLDPDDLDLLVDLTSPPSYCA